MLAISLGNFDGVHRGHAALIARARHLAGPDGDVAAVTFDPHPLTLLRPDAVPPRLTTAPEREEWLRSAGANQIVVLNPTAELLGRDPVQFLDDLRITLPFDVIVEGEDFRFGRGRSGTVTTLRARERFKDSPSMSCLALTLTWSIRRELLQQFVSAMAHCPGRLADAERVLGRPYSIKASTVVGEKRGRTIGFPTLNLAHGDQLLPSDGVYGGWVRIDDGVPQLAAISVGTKPTFGPHARLCEVHVLDVDLSMNHYGMKVHLEFHCWVRGQFVCASIDDLVARMAIDVKHVRKLAMHPVGL